MALLALHQESTDKALEVLTSQPLEPEQPAPKHSAWTTIPRALAAAGAEIGGNVMDIAGAYGQVVAATGVNANPLIPDDANTRKERLDAYDKLKTEGIDWRQEEGRQAYSFARDLRPDPQTAGTAEQITFGLTKGLTKAIGSAVVLGPAGGAATFGTSEGMTTAEDLAVQGVDQATRTKVGAVTGLVTAAGMALPVAGQTLKQTAALVAFGGPGSFIAQQAASRAILENSDYAEQAQQFDPLDPTALALATLLPAGFAAYAKRGGFATPAKPGEPPKITPDEADAVMVHNLTAAADAHESADPAPFVKAMEEANPPKQEAQPMSLIDSELNAQKGGDPFGQEGQGRRQEVLTDRPADQSPADSLDPWLEPMPPKTLEQKVADPAIRDELVKMKGETGWAETGGKIIRDIDTQEVTGRTAWVPNAEWWPGRPKGLKESAVRAAIDKAVAGEKLGAVERRTVEYMLEIAEHRAKSQQWMPEGNELADAGLAAHNELDVAMTARAAEINPDAVEALAVQHEADDAAFMRGIKELLDEHDRQNTGRSQESPAAKAADPRLEAIKAEQPDLPVRVSDDGTPIRLADELEAAKKLAQEGADDSLGLNDAPLLKVAAECFLSLGATAG